MMKDNRSLTDMDNVKVNPTPIDTPKAMERSARALQDTSFYGAINRAFTDPEELAKKLIMLIGYIVVASMVPAFTTLAGLAAITVAVFILVLQKNIRRINNSSRLFTALKSMNEYRVGRTDDTTRINKIKEIVQNHDNIEQNTNPLNNSDYKVELATKKQQMFELLSNPLSDLEPKMCPDTRQSTLNKDIGVINRGLENILKNLKSDSGEELRENDRLQYITEDINNVIHETCSTLVPKEKIEGEIKEILAMDPNDSNKVLDELKLHYLAKNSLRASLQNEIMKLCTSIHWAKIQVAFVYNEKKMFNDKDLHKYLDQKFKKTTHYCFSNADFQSELRGASTKDLINTLLFAHRIIPHDEAGLDSTAAPKKVTSTNFRETVIPEAPQRSIKDLTISNLLQRKSTNRKC